MRSGPTGWLCNACGMYYQKHGRMRDLMRLQNKGRGAIQVWPAGRLLWDFSKAPCLVAACWSTLHLPVSGASVVQHAIDSSGELDTGTFNKPSALIGVHIV